MGISSTSAKKPIRSPRFPEGLSPWRALVERTLDQLCRASGQSIQIDGAQSGSTGADGTQQFRIPAGTGGSTDASAPFYVRSDGSVVPGTIGGVTPTIGGDAIDDSPPPTLTISGSGTDYVVATINSTLSVYDGVFVEGYSAISSVVFTATSTDPGDGGMLSTTGEFKLKLATFVDGVKTAQFFTGSKSIQICDDGTGDARGAIGFVSL